MQPYQRASESIRSGQEYPIQMLKNAGLAAIGGGVARAGSKAVSSLIPAIGALINDYVPDNISRAGLSKIDPRFNKFIQGAISGGYSYEDVRKFLGDKVEKTQAQENRNIIEQYSPELHKFISEQVKSGRSPLEAGALAFQEQKAGKGFKKIIEKLVKDHKTPWASIIEAVYGSPNMAQPQQPTQAEPQPQGAQSPQQGQPQGQGQQALMSILQKIQQARGAQ